MKEGLLVLLCVTIFIFVNGLVDPCSFATNCHTCLYNNLTCGWCGSNGKCMTGNETGPTYLPCVNPYNKNATGVWQFTTSYIIDQVEDSGIMTPTSVTVFLRPGVPLPVNITIRVPFIPPIDFFFLCDASISMFPYITTVSNAMTQITLALQNLMKEGGNEESSVVFGLASFLEKPNAPFANFPEAWVYLVEQELNFNVTLTSKAFNRLGAKLARNYEHPETSLEAMMHTALDHTNVGWREGSFHITMMMSDASAHVQGQGATMGIYTPNNLDAVLDGWPPGTGEDYPSLDDVKKVLIANDVNPIFGIAQPLVVQFYRSIVDYWNFGAVVPVGSNTTVVIQSILNGTAQVLSKAILSLQEDDLSRVLSIDPNGGVYTGVQRNTSIYFTVTLEADLDRPQDFGKNSTILLGYVGFSSQVTIFTTTLVDCVGCELNNSNIVVDLCGVCGGNNSVCLGCDGVLNSGVVDDVCGVCGGQGDSCLGCDNLPYGLQWDVCGVCGGDNTTCIGCDGVANSGLEYNSCKQCGGPANCDTSLNTVIIALTSVVLAGIVLAAVSLFFLIGAGAAMAKADEYMLSQEASLQENPLYEAAKKKYDNPLWRG